MQSTPVTNGSFTKPSVKKEFPSKRTRERLLDKGVENIYAGNNKESLFFPLFLCQISTTWFKDNGSYLSSLKFVGTL